MGSRSERDEKSQSGGTDARSSARCTDDSRSRECSRHGVERRATFTMSENPIPNHGDPSQIDIARYSKNASDPMNAHLTPLPQPYSGVVLVASVFNALNAKIARLEAEKAALSSRLNKSELALVDAECELLKLRAEIERWRDSNIRLRDEMEHQAGRANVAELERDELRQRLNLRGMDSRTNAEIARERAALAQEGKP